MSHNRKSNIDKIVSTLAIPAKLIYTPTHESFSLLASRIISAHTLQDFVPNDIVPNIVSVCAFTPTFFYEEIIRHKDNRDIRKNFEIFQSYDKWVINDMDEKMLNNYETTFLIAAKNAFPHFKTLFQERSKSVRLCMFSRDRSVKCSNHLKSARFASKQSYFNRFAKLIKYAHSYAFFNWINKYINCYIIPPTNWSNWGLRDARDFALINKNIIIEYHNAWECAIILEGADKYREFVDIDIMTNSWDDNISNVLKPDIFMKQCYGDAELLDIEDAFELVISKAKGDRDADTLADQIRNVIKQIKNKLTELTGEQVSAVVKNITRKLNDLKQKNNITLSKLKIYADDILKEIPRNDKTT